MLSRKAKQVHQTKKSLMKFKNAAKRSKRRNPHIMDRGINFRLNLREDRARRKGKILKKPPNRWFSKIGPCDTWFKSRGMIHVPLPKGKRKVVRDGAEYVTNSVISPKGDFKFHKLGIYLERNYLSEKLVTKLRPAYNKAAKYFRPYMNYGNFAFAIRCCVHYGFTTKRIHDLLRLGDLLRRSSKGDWIRSHFNKWIRLNFSRRERKKVIMDFNVTFNETWNPDQNYESDSSDSSDPFDFIKRTIPGARGFG